MNKPEKVFLKSLITIALLGFGVGWLITIGKVMLMGSYWSVAPLPLTIFVAVIVPLLIGWGLVRALNALWRAK